MYLLYIACLHNCLSVPLSDCLYVCALLSPAVSSVGMSVCVQMPAYALRLPPKRLLPHNPTPDFVEERRQQLDTYLQMLLREQPLQGLHKSIIIMLLMLRNNICHQMMISAELGLL